MMKLEFIKGFLRAVAIILFIGLVALAILLLGRELHELYGIGQSNINVTSSTIINATTTTIQNI